MNFNYNTNGTFWIQGVVPMSNCPHCNALNPLENGSYICHNCKRSINMSPTANFISSSTIKDPTLIPYPLYNSKKITEISQILEVLERNDLLEKGAYFNESKYYGDFVQVYAVLTGWHITLIKETMGTKITFVNNHIQTIGDLELIVVKFRNA